MMKLAAVGMITLLVLTWAMHRSTSLAAPPSHSWWHRNRRMAVAMGLFLASLAILLIVLANDCRYLCDEGLSTVLDVSATLAAFVMGMVLTRAVKSERRSFGD